MSPFKKRVIEIVQSVPYGKVVSYSQVAAYAGVPRAARQVGWILNGTEGKVDIPWWRVINNEGKITIKGTRYNDKTIQKKLLDSEGIEVSDELLVPMSIYRFRATSEDLQKFELTPEYIEMITAKYF